MQDLGTTQLLFAVWDTKGWVEFTRGNLDLGRAVHPAGVAGRRHRR